jgi:hypothetical protein
LSSKQEVSHFKLELSRFQQEGSHFKLELSRFQQEGSHFQQEGSRFKQEGSRFKQKLPSSQPQHPAKFLPAISNGRKTSA